MAKILMLLSNPYRPDARVYNEAKSLVKGGHKVTIIAWDRDAKWPERETFEGINVIRVGPRSRGKKKFISDIRKFWKNAHIVAKDLEFDFVHCHDFDTLPLGTKLKKEKDCVLLFDSHEIYSNMIRIDVPGFIANMVQRMEDKHLRKVDWVVTVIEGHVDFYKKRVGDKVSLIRNTKRVCEITQEERTELRKEMGVGEELALVLIGSLEEKRFMEELMEASKRIDGAKIIVGGYGKYASPVEELAKDVENLVYMGYVHPDKVIPYTAAADVILSIQYPIQPLTIATKFFDAISAGTPIMVNEKGDRTTRMVKDHDCGIVIPYDVDAFIGAVEHLKAHPEELRGMTENLVELRAKYTWEAMENRLLTLYSQLTKEN